jgi:hypothetical protein
MRAFAYVVASEGSSGAGLKELARQIGFEAVQDFKTVAAAEQQALATPLIYFLFGAVARPLSLRPIARSIRAAESPRVRFAPTIYFSETPSLEAIRSCINMGFDDIITLPFALGRVEERLDRQLERPLVYYETATYFGPDRRGRLEQEEGHSLRGTGGQYRRIEIVRSSTSGVHVIKDDFHVMV